MSIIQELRAFREEIRQDIATLRGLIVGQVEEVLDIDGVAHLTKLAKSSIYQLTSMRMIPFYRKGKRLYFKRSEILAWLTARRAKTMDEIRAEAIEHTSRKPTK